MRNSLSESLIPLNAAKVRKNYYSRKFFVENNLYNEKIL